MSAITDFIVAVIKTAIYIGIIVALLYFIGKPVYRFYKKRLKWFFKYKILRSVIDEKHLNWCKLAYENELKPYELKMALLKADVFNTDEILWIYKDIYKIK